MPDGEAGPTAFGSVLASRRMCRNYLSDPVDPATLDRVLRSAFRAPSAGNTDPLELLVLTGADVGAYWDTTMDAARRASFAWPGLLAAPVLVIPYVDPGGYVRRYAEPDKSSSGLGSGQDAWTVPYWWVDGGAAVMAMLLSAEAAGLGALFFGQFDHEESLARRFDVPSDRRALGTVALGHRDPVGERVSASARRPRREVASRIHPGRW